MSRPASLESRSRNFFNRAKLTHGDRYDYSNTVFTKLWDNVIIECKIHGAFEQKANNHINGSGCQKCGNEQRSKLKRYSTDQFIKIATVKHEGLYSYKNVIYKNSVSKVKITCPYHGDYLQSPAEHLVGYGCPICALEFSNGYRESSWNNYCERYGKKIGILYVIKIYNNTESFIKIGITTMSIVERFIYLHKCGYEYKEIKSIETDTKELFLLEKRTHRKLRKYKYLPNIKFSGYTECFTIRALNELENIV